MLVGIVLRACVTFSPSTIAGFSAAPHVFIPPGVVLYGAANLNFAVVSAVREANFIFLVLIVFIVYMCSALVLANVFGLREKVGYLIGAGSCICGASAIAITSKAIDADADEVSVSLVAVFLSALLGLFVTLPLAGAYAHISGVDYGVFSGAVLQFTGFVKAAVAQLPADARSMAMSVKALRYVGLLFIIPLFSSFVKGKLHIPLYLWIFLGAGIVFSAIPELSRVCKPVLTPTLTILWSIAMGAIGLNADIKKLWTRAGARALATGLLSFFIAVGTFLVAYVMLFRSADTLF
jgi:uncharacterized integral membrane protein (TIGR00698 family)